MSNITNQIDLLNVSLQPISSAGTSSIPPIRIAYNPMDQVAVRPRSKDFDKALQSAVHDPLFMLTRQWQFGEYKFEDTGSAIFAKVAMDYTKLTRIKAQNSSAVAQAFDESMPLETVVERQPVELSLQERVRIGEEWLRFIEEDVTAFTAYRNHFLTHYTFVPPTNLTFDTDGNPTQTSEEIVTLSKTKRLYDTKEQAYLRLIAGRKVDGKQIIDAVLGSTSAFDNVISPPENSAMQLVCIVFKDWYKALYSTPETSEDCWNEKSFVYNAEMSMPHHTNSSNTVLKLKDYSSKDLEWYAFDEKPAGTSSSDMVSSSASIPNLNETDVTKKELLTVIPSQNGFPGMPAARWWEFEDGEVNFGLTNVGTTDIAKLILAEFALVYQDDWFVVPYPVEMGSYSTVQGVLVKDVFGQQTLVKHASEDYSSSTWDEWNVHNLSRYDNVQGISPAGKSLFFPPTTVAKQESESLEEVLFFRDEVANMVWALEKKKLDFRGVGEEVNKAISALENYLINLKPDETVDPTVTADLSYRLMSDVPMNWIPFIPVQDSDIGDNRAMRLQRASMPLMLPNYENVVVRPHTGFLRKGLTDADSLDASPRYYIDEEIIPKAGITLKKSNQRTRWTDGKTYLWRGTVKNVGRGQGASNLQFDQILETNKE